MARRLRAPLLAVLLPLSLAATAGNNGSAPPDAIDRVLAPLATPALRSQVLVLGTPHLSAEAARLTPGHLQPLLDRLVDFAPTRIAVESLAADEIATLAAHAPHAPAAAEVLGMFAAGAHETGRAMQEKLGIDHAAAARRAAALEATLDADADPAKRLELVALWLAAYEYDTATLQWSLLPEDARTGAATIPAEVAARLDRRLAGANEIVTLALPLARRLGLRRIHPIDSQYDGVRMLSMPADALEALFADPARGTSMDPAHTAQTRQVADDAFAAGDLLPLYRHHNSSRHMGGDATQWRWLFADKHAGGLHRFRYAMWELRNLRLATHIADVAASTRPERVLVLVGSAHKAPLERILATQLGVELAGFETIAAPPARR